MKQPSARGLAENSHSQQAEVSSSSIKESEVVIYKNEQNTQNKQVPQHQKSFLLCQKPLSMAMKQFRVSYAVTFELKRPKKQTKKQRK